MRIGYHFAIFPHHIANSHVFFAIQRQPYYFQTLQRNQTGNSRSNCSASIFICQSSQNQHQNCHNSNIVDNLDFISQRFSCFRYFNCRRVWCALSLHKKQIMMIYIQLFFTFLKIGLFGFGGGYAMLSFIQNEIVIKHQWISAQEFTDIVAISQMTPGPIGINAATYVGYTVTNNVIGSLISTFALCLPSFVLVLAVSFFYQKFKDSKTQQSAMKVIRMVVVGLIATAAITLISPETFIDYISWIIFAVAFILLKFAKLNPILIIILAGLSGLLIY